MLTLEKQGLARAEDQAELAFLVPLGWEAKRELNRLAERLRQTGVAAVVGSGDRSLKSLLRQAHSSGARWALVLGDQELERRSINVRNLRTSEQWVVPLDDVPAALAERRGAPPP